MFLIHLHATNQLHYLHTVNIAEINCNLRLIYTYAGDGLCVLRGHCQRVFSVFIIVLGTPKT